MQRVLRLILLLSVASFTFSGPLTAAPARGADAPRSVTNLPYRFSQTDAFGNNWMVYHGGRIMQQGNMPFYSDTGMLTINGQQVNAPLPQAQLEGSEVILENLQAGPFTLTRRIAQIAEGGLRICDILRNTGAREASANLGMTFNVNFGVQMTRPLADPKKPDHNLANLITDSQNRSGIDVFAGRGSKIIASCNASPNNNLVQVSYDLKVPANREIAIVHFHNVFTGQDQAEKFFTTVRDPKILSGLPAEIRKLVVNYPSSNGLFDDMELLRGGPSDVVELSNGDQLRGTLLSPTWELHAGFGKIQVSADELAGMVFPAGLQQRHLLVTTEGEILGGQLATPAIDLQLSSGQKLSVPVAQISRVGRKSPSTEEPETRPNVPMLYLRSGDRLAIKTAIAPLKIATRFAILNIKPETLSNLDLQPEQSPAHLITLNDGSRFSGLLLAENLDCQLVRGGSASFPIAAVRRILLAPTPSDATDAPATLALTGEDLLSVQLPGKLTLITAYGQLVINGPEVKRIARVKNTLEDVQLTLWDDSVLSGRFSEPSLQFALAGGTLARIPVGLIEQYSCPAPQPASGIIERITQLVAELNADDWKQREKAEAQLLAIGQPAAGTLQQLRPEQPPEAQQRIDSLLKQIVQSHR